MTPELPPSAPKNAIVILPLMIAWPGVVPAASRALTTLVDVFATLTDSTALMAARWSRFSAAKRSRFVITRYPVSTPCAVAAARDVTPSRDQRWASSP